MRPPEKFETPRLFLRKPSVADAPALFRQYTQDPEVTRFLSWKPHETVEHTRSVLERCEKVWIESTHFPFVIEAKSSGEILGMIEMRPENCRVEFGYVLARPFWGQGLMTDAMQALVQWLQLQPEVYRIWAYCDLENSGSARVLEKVGMQKEGILRRWSVFPNISNEPRDCYCYSLVK